MDPIKLIDDLLARLHYGHGHTFTWHRDGDYTGGDVEMLLRGYGIACYARRYALGGADYGVAVPRKQAVWAEYILCRVGVTLTSKPLNRRHTAGKMPVRWSRRKRRVVGLSGWIVDLLSREPSVLRNAPVRKARRK